MALAPAAASARRLILPFPLSRYGRCVQTRGSDPPSGRSPPPTTAAADTATTHPGGAGSSLRTAGGAGPPPQAEDCVGSVHTVSVDTSGLFRRPAGDGGPPSRLRAAEDVGPTLRHMRDLIRFRGGPLAVSEYMAEALTHPAFGYYMRKDVFGVKGDFVTSPEISQLFGDAVGIWCVATWQLMGSPSRLRLIELGPGRGTLMADVLRSTRNFGSFFDSIDVRMVEVSPALRKLQHQTLRCDGVTPPDDAPDGFAGGRSGCSGEPGPEVSWHRELTSVPGGVPTLILAHEFFDALPVHQFEKTQERGWCERLVDLDDDAGASGLRFVLSPGATPATALLVPRRLKALPESQRDEITRLEISARSLAVAQELATRVGRDTGAVLAVDYGTALPNGFTLQAIRDHKFVEILERTGEADLSAYVDFGALAMAAESSGAACKAYGPVDQGELLQALGVDARLEMLMQSATPSQAKALAEQRERLVGNRSGADGKPPGMGVRYKALTIASEGLVPVGF